MKRYVLFVNTDTEYYLYPVSSFVGAVYYSATQTYLYFEKAPISIKVLLTHENLKGPNFLIALGNLFNNSAENVIVFNDLNKSYATDYVTAVSSITKVVIK